MTERSSFSGSAGGDLELLVLLPDQRSVTHVAHSNCPMMDLLIQIASKENLKPSAYVIEALDSSVDDEDHNAKPTIRYKPNTPIGMLNTQVIRLAVKNSTAPKTAPAQTNGSKSRDSKINYSESFSNRVQNFNKMSGVSAVQICNDPDGFNKLSEDTKMMKSKSNFITSTLPPQVSGKWCDSSQTLMKSFRLQIHLPYEQLHVIRVSPECSLQHVLDIIHEERGLRLDKYHVLKTNEPELSLNLKGTLKEHGITELTLKLRPEFEVIRNVNPKKVKKENSSHFRSAFKSFFHQLKPSSRSNSVTELRPTSDIVRPKSEVPRVNNEEFTKPKPPPRKRGQAPPPPPSVQSGNIRSGLVSSRSHTASESSCESMGEGSVGGSAPATLPRRCRLAPESASTTNLALEPPAPTLRRGVSDMAVNKPKYPRRKRAAPKPPTPISSEELAEDEEQAATPKMGPPLNSFTSSQNASDFENVLLYKSNNYDYTEHDVEQIVLENNDTIDTTNHNLRDIERIEVIEELPNYNDDHIEDRLLQKDQIIHKEELTTHTREQPIQNEVIAVLKEDQSVSNEDPKACYEEQERQNRHTFVFIDKSLNIDIAHNADEINHKKEYNLEEAGPCIVLNDSPTLEVRKDSDKIAHTENKSMQDQDDSIHIEKETIHNVLKINKSDNSTTHMEVKPLHDDISSDDRLGIIEKQPVLEEVNTVDTPLEKAPPASQFASYHKVEHPVAVDKPESKVSLTNPRTVNSINKINPSVNPPPLPKLTDISRSTKQSPQRSNSLGATLVSKPTVDDLLKQIQKMKQNKKVPDTQNLTSNKRTLSVIEFKHTQVNDTSITNEVKKSIEQPEIVGIIPKRQTIRIPLKPDNEYEQPVELNSPAACVTPPVSPTADHIPVFNGNGSGSEEERSRLVSDVVTRLNSVEEKITDPGVSRGRPLPKFMLTSWTEEKRAPVVNRIADYGSRNSTTQANVWTAGTIAAPHKNVVQSERRTEQQLLPFALSATLPRPFATSTGDIRSNEVMTTGPKLSPVNNTLPTIINVVEKVNHNKPNDNGNSGIIPGNTQKRQSAYARLNMYNMSPTILPDSHLDSYGNGGSINITTKPSWELVKDASKKLEENKLNGEQVLSEEVVAKARKFLGDNNLDGNKNKSIVGKANGNKSIENGIGKDESVRHVYKYPKPLQFQLGTWTDKSKTLKIDPEGNIEHKNDPPLVTELDEVAVWSATY